MANKKVFAGIRRSASTSVTRSAQSNISEPRVPPLVRAADPSLFRHFACNDCGILADYALLSLHHQEQKPPELILASGRKSPVAAIDAVLEWTDALLRRNLTETGPISPSLEGRMLIEGREYNLSLTIFPQIDGVSMVATAVHEPTSQSPRSKVVLSPTITTYLTKIQNNCARAALLPALSDVVAVLSIGVCLVNGEASLLYANEAAQLIIDGSDGLQVVNDRILGNDVADTIRLHTAISHVMAGNSVNEDERPSRRIPIVALNRKTGARPLVVAAIPTRRLRSSANGDIVLLYLYSPEGDSTRLLQPFFRMYGLSPVEGKLTALIANGLSLSAAATAMHVKEQTARAYLKQIFLKTSTNRQADLVRVMLSSVLPIRSDMEPDLV